MAQLLRCFIYDESNNYKNAHSSKLCRKILLVCSKNCDEVEEALVKAGSMVVIPRDGGTAISQARVGSFDAAVPKSWLSHRGCGYCHRRRERSSSLSSSHWPKRKSQTCRLGHSSGG